MQTVFAVAICVAGEAKGETEVGGLLPKENHWTVQQGPYLVTHNLEIPAGGTLVVDPGVVIRLQKGEKHGYSIIVSGTLIARGSAQKPIMFTSARPDPSPQDWGDIQFVDSTTDAQLGPDDKYLRGTILEHCIIEYSHGILVRQSSPLIDTCVFRLNRSPSGGGAIIVESGMPLIRANRITNNRAAHDGGGIRTLECSPRIEDNFIAFNEAGQAGGGIAADYSAPILRRNTVIFNSADGNGGGIATGETTYGQSSLSGKSASKPVIEDNVVAHNSCYGNGAGIYVAGSPTIRRNVLVHNVFLGDAAASRRTHHCGAAVYVSGTFEGPAIIEGNIMAHNTDAVNGGAMFLEAASAEIEKNLFANNESKECGSAIALALRRQQGGLFGFLHGATYQIANNEFAGESAAPAICAGGDGQEVKVRKCNFINIPSAFANFTPHDVALDGCYFGTTDRNQINRLIKDHYDDEKNGRAIVEKPATDRLSLDMPQLDGDLAIWTARPSGVTARVIEKPSSKESTWRVEVAWNAMELQNVAGYRVHFDDDRVRPPFFGIHETTVHQHYVKWDLIRTVPIQTSETKTIKAAPIDVGNATGIVLDLPYGVKRVALAVTAYDKKERQSAYSDPVTVELKQ